MLFDPEDEQEIRKRLLQMTQKAKMVLFTQTLDCDTCLDAEQLLKAVAELSDLIELQILNPHVDRDRAHQYGVSKVPALIIEGDRDYGIRYYGVPGGYEFASLLEDLVAVGKRESGLSDASKEKIQSLTEPLNLKVFVTPT